jgi:hypothetical protein
MWMRAFTRSSAGWERTRNNLLSQPAKKRRFKRRFFFDYDASVNAAHAARHAHAPAAVHDAARAHVRDTGSNRSGSNSDAHPSTGCHASRSPPAAARTPAPADTRPEAAAHTPAAVAHKPVRRDSRRYAHRLREPESPQQQRTLQRPKASPKDSSSYARPRCSAYSCATQYNNKLSIDYFSFVSYSSL